MEKNNPKKKRKKEKEDRIKQNGTEQKEKLNRKKQNGTEKQNNPEQNRILKKNRKKE